MQVTVNIEDSKLNSLIEQGVDTLPLEEIGALAKEAIKKALDDPNTAQSLVFRTSYGEMELRRWFEEAITKQITEKDIAEFKDAILEHAKKDGREIFIAAIADVFTRHLFTFDNQTAFREQIMAAVSSMPPKTY